MRLWYYHKNILSSIQSISETTNKQSGNKLRNIKKPILLRKYSITLSYLIGENDPP
jgi:hypothetical protein